MQLVRLAYAFNGRNIFSVHGRGEQNAGAHCLAIDKHGAGPAVACAAGLFDAGKAQTQAQAVHQGFGGLHMEFFFFPIDSAAKFHSHIRYSGRFSTSAGRFEGAPDDDADHALLVRLVARASQSGLGRHDAFQGRDSFIQAFARKQLFQTQRPTRMGGEPISATGPRGMRDIPLCGGVPPKGWGGSWSLKIARSPDKKEIRREA
jgi:hypothetical protein